MQSLFNESHLITPVHGERLAVSLYKREEVERLVEQEVAVGTRHGVGLGIIELGEHLHALQPLPLVIGGESTHRHINRGVVIKLIGTDILLIELLQLLAPVLRRFAEYETSIFARSAYINDN